MRYRIVHIGRCMASSANDRRSYSMRASNPEWNAEWFSIQLCNLSCPKIEFDSLFHHDEPTAIINSKYSFVYGWCGFVVVGVNPLVLSMSVWTSRYNSNDLQSKMRSARISLCVFMFVWVYVSVSVCHTNSKTFELPETHAATKCKYIHNTKLRALLILRNYFMDAKKNSFRWLFLHSSGFCFALNTPYKL